MNRSGNQNVFKFHSKVCQSVCKVCTLTSENIAFSAALIGGTDKDVGIVTNNFHVFRGVMLARHAGFEDACGISARSNVYFQPNNLVREFFGIMKDLVCGNLL